MVNYFSEISRSMEEISMSDSSIFIGQAVAVAGTAMRNTLVNIPQHKLIEFPVDEDVQLGFSIGLSLAGFTPISIFPRWNFLLLATNQIVNHLDKLKELSGVNSSSKVIIRTGIGSEKPLHPGPQHTGDFSEAFKLMCRNLEVIKLETATDIYEKYMYAFSREDGISTLFVENMDLYN
jgi:pyruvate/2-oxoglutarate/acetoin dehydrogenase E1 component